MDCMYHTCVYIHACVDEHTEPGVNSVLKASYQQSGPAAGGSSSHGLQTGQSQLSEQPDPSGWDRCPCSANGPSVSVISNANQYNSTGDLMLNFSFAYIWWSEQLDHLGNKTIKSNDKLRWGRYGFTTSISLSYSFHTSVTSLKKKL